MGTVPVSVSWRSKLDRFVDGSTAKSSSCVVTFGEKPSSDYLFVAGGSGKARSSFANAFPAGGDGAEVQIGETAAFRPDSGVEDGDYHVGAVVGVRPEALLVFETEELRGTGGVEFAAAVGEDSEDGGVELELGELGGSEGGGEAMEDRSVHVE